MSTGDLQLRADLFAYGGLDLSSLEQMAEVFGAVSQLPKQEKVLAALVREADHEVARLLGDRVICWCSEYCLLPDHDVLENPQVIGTVSHMTAVPYRHSVDEFSQSWETGGLGIVVTPLPDDVVTGNEPLARFHVSACLESSAILPLNYNAVVAAWLPILLEPDVTTL